MSKTMRYGIHKWLLSEICINNFHQLFQQWMFTAVTIGDLQGLPDHVPVTSSLFSPWWLCSWRLLSQGSQAVTNSLCSSNFLSGTLFFLICTWLNLSSLSKFWSDVTISMHPIWTILFITAICLLWPTDSCLPYPELLFLSFCFIMITNL